MKKLPTKQIRIIQQLSCFLIIGLVSLSLIADNLPDLGSSDRAVFSQSQEAALSKSYMQQLRASGQVIEDPIDRQYINDLGMRLVAANGQQNNGHFYFFFMASPEINAFAGPNGYIAVYSGLMLATSNEEELASVMAHEIAHVLQGHIARKIADASKQKYKTLAGMLAAVALGTVSGEAAEAAILTTVAGSQQSMLNFSRQMEAEADRMGIRLLANAGFNPSSMPDFFTKLENNERYYMKIPELLSNHPLTPDRIADAENRAAQYSPRHHKTPQEYYLIKERLRVIATANPHNIISYYQQLLKKQNLKHRFAKQYGYALALQNNQEFTQALSVMKKLMTDYPDQLIFQLGVADIAADAQKPEIALPIMDNAYALYPDSYPVTVEYVYALFVAKKYQQALDVLRQHRLDYPNDPIPYSLVSRVQAKLGLLAQAYQTRAAYLVEYGNLPAALSQLQVALKLPKLTTDEKDKIKAQIKGIRQQMHQMQQNTSQ